MSIVKTFKNIPLLRKLLLAALAIGVLFICYGTTARWLNIYFFWESVSWGLGIAVLSAVMLGLHLGWSNEKGEERLWFLLLGGVAFVLYIGIIYFFNFYVPGTSVYKTAVDYIKQSDEVKAEVGSITGVSLLPQVSKHTINSVSVTHLSFTVKGTIKYIDIDILLFKSPEQPVWKVLTAEDNIDLSGFIDD